MESPKQEYDAVLDTHVPLYCLLCYYSFLFLMVVDHVTESTALTCA
jgi:hypothetical protein